MRVLVCGDRNWSYDLIINTTLDGLKFSYPKLVIISGMAKGADMCAVMWARANDIPLEEFHADWKKFGRLAGPMRNRKMLKSEPDLILAFHSNLEYGSKGTLDMCNIAQKAGVPVYVIGRK